MDCNLLKFETALKNAKPIHIINNTCGVFFCMVSDPISCKRLKIEFKNTRTPYCLTDLLPPGVLETSVEIRNSLRQNILRFLDENEVLRYISSAKGRSEYMSLNRGKVAQAFGVKEIVAQNIRTNDGLDYDFSVGVASLSAHEFIES